MLHDGERSCPLTTLLLPHLFSPSSDTAPLLSFLYSSLTSSLLPLLLPHLFSPSSDTAPLLSFLYSLHYPSTPSPLLLLHYLFSPSSDTASLLSFIYSLHYLVYSFTSTLPPLTLHL
ncbi:hypothetical protein Pmani_039061 [Petrolisthes manimaculis]|uniref:Uncharacterized protein n=1 Tax=Petrolisthes manimaculis TaxID=1843537 RepID=A0AAE1NFQ4_9EUCA|nr:hypothetical protein Pmani_039061 [Petrolisthes manimaculis]